jgi:hypothetical protein
MSRICVSLMSGGGCPAVDFLDREAVAHEEPAQRRRVDVSLARIESSVPSAKNATRAPPAEPLGSLR